MPRPQIWGTQICVGCGISFLRTHPARKWCSEQCRNRGQVHVSNGVARKCETCGEIFRGWHQSRSQRFCSLHCAGKAIPHPRGHWVKWKKISCENCGKIFERPPSTAKKARFCSDKCKGASWGKLKANIVCKNCGAEFEVSAHQDNKAKYCSLCYPKMVRRKYRRHHGLRAIMREAGIPERCAMCGYNEFPQVLHVHHLDKVPSNNESGNLEYLCPTCHAVLHRVFHH